MITLPWDEIQSVFLDMDGTLLDLHFDNHFWQQHLPMRYAEKHGMSFEQAQDELVPRFRAAEGTLAWYSITHWEDELDMDIVELKQEVAHLIDVFPYVPEFLARLRSHGKRVVLVTNAHAKSLNLKMERTKLGGHFDDIHSSHDFHAAKESQDFWRGLQEVEHFQPEHTLMIDDTLSVLRSAQEYGIRHLLAVHRPDSKADPRDTQEFDAITSFREITPPIPETVDPTS
ncbi:MAG: GMP/IMP nucleotidase [Gammaproteobacteria bacterium]|nr:GMP/IMP nucleotidase [Gammaproteobacteria bacterium]